MWSFICNICGAPNETVELRTEPESCACGSNVRVRALIHLLSMELFGQSLPLRDFPRLKSIRGLGMTDKPGYADLLAEKFDYTNTFYDREPRLDASAPDKASEGRYDFIVSADVLEHIGPPIEQALKGLWSLLNPHGFLIGSVFCNSADQLREHFPELHQYRVIQLGGAAVLANRRRDGTLEIRDDLIFHGGSGSTLEMREFGSTALRDGLLSAGFLEVYLFSDNLPEKGILFDGDVSQPFVARKERFSLDREARADFVAEWRREKARAGLFESQISLANGSRWLRLGALLGVGPRFKRL